MESFLQRGIFFQSIKLFRNCKCQISNKPYQCRWTNYWSDENIIPLKHKETDQNAKHINMCVLTSYTIDLRLTDTYWVCHCPVIVWLYNCWPHKLQRLGKVEDTNGVIHVFCVFCCCCHRCCLFLWIVHSWLFLRFSPTFVGLKYFVRTYVYKIPPTGGTRYRKSSLYCDLPPVFSGVRLARSLVFCVMFCSLSFFFCPLCCLSFFDLITLPITPLISSNFT